MGRTYVRRRIAASLLVTVVAVIAFTGPVASALDSSDTPVPTADRTYLVRPGDTLWAIAQRVAPGSDPRATVLLIGRANGVEASSLRPGDVLRIPIGS